MERFSVYQYFQDGSYEKVRDRVDLPEALQGAIHYSSSLAVRLGLVARVIITDVDDSCVFEWKYGEGVVFPPLATQYSTGQAGSGKTTALCAWLNKIGEVL